MNQHTAAAARTTRTVIAGAIIASLVPVIVDARDGVTAGFSPRGDADCSVHLSAADVTSTVNGLAGHSRCGNDDCDRDGQVTAADVDCAARCLFGACPVPPHAPRVIAVAPDTAPGIVPSSAVRVTVTNLGPTDRLKRVTIGDAEADVVGMITADTLLAVVPDVSPGPADVVAIDGDLAGAPLRITVTAAVPIGTLDSFEVRTRVCGSCTRRGGIAWELHRHPRPARHGRRAGRDARPGGRLRHQRYGRA